MKAIKDIVCYLYLLPFETTEENVDAFMAAMAEAGVTHIQINHLPDLMHPEQLNQPDNVYLWFANYGPPLDLFVSSQLNHGLYPEMYLERNRRVLLRCAAAARRHGLKPLLYLCEPRFVPERFFARHPTLRGPRVDNPTCSRQPLYALCTDLPEVQEHYREMMARMLELVPDLTMATLFTSDSGAGFDYNPDTYAGPNGAGFNRAFPLEQRVVRFLKILLEEGRRKNPRFTINLTSGFSPEWREKILKAAPEGIVGSVYSLWSWTGGFEEHWAYHQSRFNVRALDRTKARNERAADMRGRFEIAARGGKEPIVYAEVPTNGYPWPLRYTPHPFETIRIMKSIAALGATKIVASGMINPKTLVPFDVNQDAMKAINDDIGAKAEDLVRQIAERWVGKPHGAALIAAWKDCDWAWSRQPFWSHFGLTKPALPGPLVPDLTTLKPEEIAYYRTIGLADLEMIQGVGSWVPHEPDERNRDFVLREIYEKETLPMLRRAVRTLEKQAARASAKAKKVLLQQADHIRVAYLYQRSLYNWYEAGRHLAPGKNAGRGRSMRQIVDDEIQNTRAWIKALDGHLDQFVCTYPSDYMTYTLGPSFVEHLQQRIPVMQAHRQDLPRNLSGRLGKTHAYWKGLSDTE